MVTQYRRRPRETNARLEVFASLDSVIEAAAGSVLAGEINITGSNVVIRLLILGFNPRGVRIIAQTEVQRSVDR